MFASSWQKEIEQIRAGARPELGAVQSLSGGNTNQVVLLLHGYAGSPFDFSPLYPHLNEIGVDFSCTHLAGHRDPADLPGTTADKWLADVFKKYDELAAVYRDVYVIGFSLGGLLALHLAAQRPVAKLILLSPYFGITQKWYYFGTAEKWAGRFSSVMPAIRKLQSGQINNRSGRSAYRSLKHMPLQPVAEIKKLALAAGEHLPTIQSETVWFHSVGDDVTDFNESQTAFSKLNCPTRLFLKLERSNHIVLFDYDGPPVMDTVTSMIAAGMEKNKRLPARKKKAPKKANPKTKTRAKAITKSPAKKKSAKKTAKKTAKKKTTKQPAAKKAGAKKKTTKKAARKKK